jgi:hypothetical protein
VLLSRAQTRWPLSPDRFGLTATLQAGPANRPPGDFPYQAQEVVPRGIGLRPFAPVHPRRRETETGPVLSWIRRSRLGGDNWSAAEIPLAEADERYRVAIFDAADAVLLETTVETPEIGLPQGAARAEIAQISDLFGPGSTAVWQIEAHLSG